MFDAQPKKPIYVDNNKVESKWDANKTFVKNVEIFLQEYKDKAIDPSFRRVSSSRRKLFTKLQNKIEELKKYEPESDVYRTLEGELTKYIIEATYEQNGQPAVKQYGTIRQSKASLLYMIIREIQPAALDREKILKPEDHLQEELTNKQKENQKLLEQIEGLLKSIDNKVSLEQELNQAKTTNQQLSKENEQLSKTNKDLEKLTQEMKMKSSEIPPEVPNQSKTILNEVQSAFLEKISELENKLRVTEEHSEKISQENSTHLQLISEQQNSLQKSKEENLKIQEELKLKEQQINSPKKKNSSIKSVVSLSNILNILNSFIYAMVKNEDFVADKSKQLSDEDLNILNKEGFLTPIIGTGSIGDAIIQRITQLWNTVKSYTVGQHIQEKNGLLKQIENITEDQLQLKRQLKINSPLTSKLLLESDQEIKDLKEEIDRLKSEMGKLKSPTKPVGSSLALKNGVLNIPPTGPTDFEPSPNNSDNVEELKNQICDLRKTANLDEKALKETNLELNKKTQEVLTLEQNIKGAQDDRDKAVVKKQTAETERDKAIELKEAAIKDKSTETKRAERAEAEALKLQNKNKDLTKQNNALLESKATQLDPFVACVYETLEKQTNTIIEKKMNGDEAVKLYLNVLKEKEILKEEEAKKKEETKDVENKSDPTDQSSNNSGIFSFFWKTKKIPMGQLPEEMNQSNKNNNNQTQTIDIGVTSSANPEAPVLTTNVMKL